MLRCFSRRAILAVLTTFLCAGVFPLPAQESSPPLPRITAYKNL
jgi:hypothetical protein